MIGTNLGYGPDPARAAAEVRAIVGHAALLPRISALEIGNEVASFGKASGGGHRPYPYTFAEYSAEISHYVATFRAAAAAEAGSEEEEEEEEEEAEAEQQLLQLPSRFLQSLVFAHPYDWQNDTTLTVPAFLQEHASAVYSLCVHSYALSQKDRDAGRISAATMLSSYAAKEHALTYSQLAADARAAGLPLVIGEGNSVSQGGAKNISDVYISALWSLDFFPEISKVRVRHYYDHDHCTVL